ncbi:unnamed protein product, partial [Prorocentrum cordatum]
AGALAAAAAAGCARRARERGAGCFGGGGSGGAPEAVNDFFKGPLRALPELEAALRPKAAPVDLTAQLTQVGSPGVPRPLWLVIAASVPTALLWYGAGQRREEMYVADVGRPGPDGEPGQAKGFGGPGTLGPFVLGLALGPLAALLGLPGGEAWSAVGFVWIYYTQYLLYARVNELYESEGLAPPLHVWWLVFPGFNLIIGLRQVHFLSKFWATQRGSASPRGSFLAPSGALVAAEAGRNLEHWTGLTLPGARGLTSSGFDPGLLDVAGAEGVGDSCHTADASPMRLDVEPDLLHVDVADAKPTSTMHGRCIADASPMHGRCGAILRRHLIIPTPFRLI